jgi:hypothetical protein
MMNWFQQSITNVVVFGIQWYSAFVFKLHQRFPWGLKIINDVLYIADAFFTGKLIEPFNWEVCVGFFDKDRNYVEMYDQLDLTGMNHKLVLTHRGNLIQTQHIVDDIIATESEPVKYRFLSVVYTCKDDVVEINVPDIYYAEGNELFSCLFVARFLKHHCPDVSFDMSYDLSIVDFNCEHFTINSGSYLVLTRDSYFQKQIPSEFIW